MTRQPLWVILCHLLEKGRREIEEMVEMKEGQGRKENEWQKRNKNIPPVPLPAAVIAGLA